MGKNKGQVIFGQSRKEEFNPNDSKINFAIPYKRVMRTIHVEGHVSPDAISPGVNSQVLWSRGLVPILPPVHLLAGGCHLLDQIGLLDNMNKTSKLCLDGKKINASTSGKTGDIDLFGFQQTPTQCERKERFQKKIEAVKQTEGLLVENTRPV